MRRPKTQPGPAGNRAALARRDAAAAAWEGISQHYPAAVALLQAAEAALTARTATGDTAGYGAPTVEPEIGAKLFISAKTASVRVSNILAKLGVTGRGEAAAAAHRQRPLHPAPEPLQQLVVVLGRDRR